MTNPYIRRRIEASQRRAHRRRCRRCGRWTWVGLDDDRVAMLTAVDIDTVDHVHEIAALLAGRRTYELDHHCLYYRDQWRARKEPEHSTLHLEHECEADNDTPTGYLPAAISGGGAWHANTARLH